MAPRSAKMAPRSVKMGQDGAKIGQDGAKMDQVGANFEDFDDFSNFGLFFGILRDIAKNNVFIDFFSFPLCQCQLKHQQNCLIELSIVKLLPTASFGLVWRGSGPGIHLPNALESR